MNDSTLALGDIIHGFRLTASDAIPELHGLALQFEHVTTGARVFHLKNEDDENLFSVNFPTPPPDDTGTPHILEHAVLGGSSQYPIREPFFELTKMSMATFLNAMTGYDCTYYPVASNVKQDLFNLADVYLDALLHPLLTDQTLMREGHHLAPTDPSTPEGEMAITGVVFNEMKGFWASPESKLSRMAVRQLLPDTIYSRESGGLPEAIPDLTWSALRAYHRRYYHPSNAFCFFYGNIPTEEYLAFLAKRLSGYGRESIPPWSTTQPRWTEPRQVKSVYPISAGEGDTSKSFIALQWLAGDATNAEEVVTLHLLSLILLGNEAAPLRRAIVDSHLGEDLVLSGDAGAGRELAFGVGIRGTESDRVQPFTELVSETLNRIVSEGIPAARVEAAFQQASYFYLEILPMFPIHLMDRVLSAWIYGVDPLTYLHLGACLQRCREKYSRDPSLFTQWIREWLLDNPHRLTIVLTPDRQAEEQDNAKLRALANTRQAALSRDQLREVARQAAEVQAESGTPNPPEALAKLPQLAVSDLPAHPQRLPTEKETIAGVPLLVNNVFSNGINYVHIYFDTRDLPDDLWMFVPRYSEAIAQMGAAGCSFEVMTHRVASSTGGISCGPEFTTRADNPDVSTWGIRFTLRALDEQFESALTILSDYIFSLDPRDRNRLHDMIIQSRARARSYTLSRPESLAALQSARGLSNETFRINQVRGLPQVEMTEHLASNFETDCDGLIERIEQLRDFLLCRQRMTVSFTGSAKAAQCLRRTLPSWASRMSSKPYAQTRATGTRAHSLFCEGLAVPIPVAHCVLAMPAPHVTSPDFPLLRLATELVESEFLRPEIRFKGNAYGASCTYQALTRQIILGSYRDPHISRTINVFQDARNYVATAAWTQTDVNRAIIATAKSEFTPIRPGDATGRALSWHLSGYTPEIQQAHYDDLRAARVETVRDALLRALDAGLPRSSFCAAANRTALEKSGASWRGTPMTILDIRR